jgi:hypothetical protein
MAEEFDLFICRQRQPMILIPLLMAVSTAMAASLLLLSEL